ncbi:hypothetical protein AMELA_G00224340 [Ameiurus melas]|uniref:Uncharacterized protein n=1 Tax=Ameiurus melas TaxID=219545 RepID=A0A7J6A137_AMEME|nr:hypothetical protein AMELA_G00224340 [Ameiurus melas]
MSARPFSLFPLLEGVDLDLNTRYQVAHLTADITVLLDIFHTPTPNGHAGFPPPLRYRILPANVCVDASTQTDPLPDLPSIHSEDDVAFSDLGSDGSSFSLYSPASPPFSQYSSYYTYADPCYTLSSGRTPFSSPCLFPQDYSPTSPVNFQ